MDRRGHPARVRGVRLPRHPQSGSPAPPTRGPAPGPGGHHRRSGVPVRRPAAGHDGLRRGNRCSTAATRAWWRRTHGHPNDPQRTRWLKVKVRHAGRVVIGGGIRREDLNALLVGRREGGRLRFLGVVEFGVRRRLVEALLENGRSEARRHSPMFLTGTARRGLNRCFRLRSPMPK